MPTVAELLVKIALEDGDFRSGVTRASRELEKLEDKAEDAGKKVQSFGERLDKAGALADSWGNRLSAGVTAPIVAAAGAAVKFASDASESLSKVNVVFGASASTVEAWSKSAVDSLGVSGGQALESAGTFGNLFTTMGLGQAEAAKLSTEIVQLGADLGSFHNLGTEEALEKLRSGLVGEAEPLRSLGVLLTEDNVKAKALAMGLADASGELSEAAKVQARYALIMEQTGAAQGDFARTSDEVAGSTKKVMAEARQLAEEVGKDLLPIARDLLHTVRDWLHAFRELDPETQKFILKAGLMAAALGPLLKGLSGILSVARAVGPALGAIRGIGAAGGLLGGAGGAGAAGAAANPVGALVAGAIAARTGGEALLPGGDNWMGTAKQFLLRSPLEHLGLTVANAGHLLRGEKLQTEFTYGDFLKGGKKPEEQKAAAAPTAVKPSVLAPTGPKSIGSAEEIQDAKDALAAAELERAKALAGAAGEGQRAQSEASLVLPQIRQQMEALVQQARELEPQAAESAKKQKELGEVRKRYWNLVAEGQQLQQAAEKEVADATEKAAEEARKAQELQFEVAREAAAYQAQQRVLAHGEEVRAQAEYAALVPVLQARQAALSVAARSAQTAVQLGELQKEWAGLQRQIGDLQLAAAREWDKNAAEEEKRYAELAQAANQATEKQIAALAAGAPEGEQAQKLLEVSLPYLLDKMQGSLEDAEAYGAGTREYFQFQGEYWDTQRELTELQQKAAKEQQDATKRAADAAKKAGEETRTLAEAQTKLHEARINNLLGLNPQQRGKLLFPALLNQLRANLAPVAGENELDRTKRLTEAEGVKSQMLRALGINEKGGFGPNFDLRAFREADLLVRQAESQAYRATPQAPPLAPAGGEAPVNFYYQPNLGGMAPADALQNPAFKAELDYLVGQLIRKYRRDLGGG